MTTAPAIELRTFTTLDTARGDNSFSRSWRRLCLCVGAS
jgi:hypothetical protein